MQFIFVESEISISNGIHSNTFYFNRLHLNLAINFWSKSWSFYYFLKLRICIFSSTCNCRVYRLPKKISQYDWLNKNTINMLILRNFVSLLTLQIFYNWEKIWLYWMWICYILVKPHNFITSSNLFWILCNKFFLSKSSRFSWCRSRNLWIYQNWDSFVVDSVFRMVGFWNIIAYIWFYWS